LITHHDQNRRALWSAFGGPAAIASPYAVAKEKKFDQLAAYIQAQLSRELSQAVDNDNLAHVRECSEAGGLPDFDGVENVAVAIRAKNLDMVRFLLDGGARIPASRFQNVQTIEKDTYLSQEMRWLLRQRFLDRALRIAASQGNIAAVTEFHQQGGDLSAMNSNGATPLSLSLQFTHAPAVAHYLVTRGGTMLHKQAGVSSCIPLSRSPGHPPNNQLESFLKQSLNVALFNAVMEGDLATSGELCALGAEVGAVDETGNTLVHTAVQFQGVDTVKWLTERGAPLNVPNEAGEYAITAATLKGDAASVELIIKTNAGTKALKNSAGKTALDLAKEARYNKLVQLMDPVSILPCISVRSPLTCVHVRLQSFANLVLSTGQQGLSGR
jgi:ankyrin repeat protein